MLAENTSRHGKYMIRTLLVTLSREEYDELIMELAYNDETLFANRATPVPPGNYLFTLTDIMQPFKKDFHKLITLDPIERLADLKDPHLPKQEKLARHLFTTMHRAYFLHPEGVFGHLFFVGPEKSQRSLEFSLVTMKFKHNTESQQKHRTLEKRLFRDFTLAEYDIFGNVIHVTSN